MSYMIETQTEIAAPAEFASNFLLDIRNRPKLSRLPDGREPEVWWEGEPWQPGSALVIRTPTTIGQSVTVKGEVLTPEPGGLFRTVMRKFGLRMTGSCSVQEAGPEACVVTQTMMLEGWASVFAKLVPVDNAQQMQDSLVRSEIELAWLRTKQTGEPSA